MLFSLLLLIVVLLPCLRIRNADERRDYMSKESCAAVKGVFVCYVFLRHAWTYLPEVSHGLGGRLLTEFNAAAGQLLVVMFLFYSGYGVAESVRRKGVEYVRTMPRRRILNTLLNFDVAVLAFVVMDFVLGGHVGVRQGVLSLVGWDSVGNSNWYIFAILCCYGLSYFSYMLIRSFKLATWMLAVSMILFIIVLSYLRPVWWYSTVLAFSAGAFFSLYRKPFEALAVRCYWPMVAAALAGILVLPNNQSVLHGLPYNIKSIAFAILVVMLSMRVKIVGPIFSWCGDRLFPIYIYQRIPMIALSACAPQLTSCKCLEGGGFLVACATVTIVIAWLYRHWEIKL